MLMKKYAYLNNDGIYFDLSKVDQPYGALSNRSLPTIANEAHVNKQIADFALWKNTKTGKTWFNKLTKQRGRPGWHTECALFIKQFFKNQPIDIHGGGIDLLFPHHENERIQLMATNHLQEPVANWMYVGMLTNNHTKMSKSIGNIIFVKDFVAETGCNSFRYLVMQSDYHKPLNFSNQLLQNAQIKIKQWQSLILTTYIWICGESKTKTFNNQPDLNYINQFKATISQNLDSNKVCFLLDALKDDIMKAININHQTTINLFEAFLEIIINLGFKVNKPTMWQFYNIKTKIKCWISWQQQKDFVRADLKLNELKKTITTILNN